MEAQSYMMTLAKDNERLHVLLRKYMEKDDQLHSMSQMSNASGDVAATLGLGHDMDPGTSQMSQLTELSEPGEEAQLSSVYEFIDSVKALKKGSPSKSKAQIPPPAPLRPERIPTGIGVMIVDPESHPGCVLVGRRRGSHGAGKYALPGGHLEKHESWRTCATRELKEETDLEIPEDSMSFVWVDNSDMPEEAKHYTTIFLLAPLPEGSSPPQNMEPNKCDGWEWISWIDLQKRAAAEPTSLFIPLLNCLTKGCDPFNVPGGKFSSDAL
mmetsp:Transcript_11159/g.41670  ORF Transcript_11159/g.41670 Transcript_11159/m.41670 type:complete len:269 (+) Transcript_11159:78-884(+)